mgnify:CR=1 FL=1
MTDLMTRRRLFALGLGGAAAAAVTVTTSGTTEPRRPSVLTFFDPRFGASSSLARALPAAGPLVAVESEIGHLVAIDWQALADGTLRLQGVTTEIVPFCLEHAIPRHAGLRARVERVDRDLFSWSLGSPATAPA